MSGLSQTNLQLTIQISRTESVRISDGDLNLCRSLSEHLNLNQITCVRILQDPVTPALLGLPDNSVRDIAFFILVYYDAICQLLHCLFRVLQSPLNLPSSLPAHLTRDTLQTIIPGISEVLFSLANKLPLQELERLKQIGITMTDEQCSAIFVKLEVCATW